MCANKTFNQNVYFPIPASSLPYDFGFMITAPPYGFGLF